MNSERWFCLDCNMFGPLTKHGFCATCGSSAVISGETHRPMDMPVGETNEIRELYRIFAL